MFKKIKTSRFDKAYRKSDDVKSLYSEDVEWVKCSPMSHVKPNVNDSLDLLFSFVSRDSIKHEHTICAVTYY